MPQVALLDGTLVDCASEEWRHECEARAVLSMRGLQNRRDYLELVGKKRGDAEKQRLQKTMTALWRQRKDNDKTAAA